MAGKEGPSVDRQGNPYNYIVVIDAGSKGSRAHLYRSSLFMEKLGSSTKRGHGDDDDDDSDDDDDDDDEKSHEKHKSKHKSKDKKKKKPSSWSEKPSDKLKAKHYPRVEFIHRKKVKPGIATFVDNPKKLGSKYIGKLLAGVEKYIPKDQRARTPVFLHATGGMRLLKPEDQTKILTTICEYVQQHSNLYLPDCATHINTISGETEGLYSWIGLNYKYGVFDTKSKDSSTYGALDMGGVSSQIAFEPSNISAEDGYLFKVQLNYASPDDTEKLNYRVFSESFLGGMNQAHIKYDEFLIQQNNLVDPCLPDGFIKTVDGRDGLRVDVKGSSNFKECIKSVYSVLDGISADKYCNQTDASSAASCLLSDNFPDMDFNVKKLIGINEFYSNLKEFLNYRDCYERAERYCSLSYTELLSENGHIEDDDEIRQTSEICFKSSWIINVLHQGVGFPRYGIDEPMPEESVNLKPDDFAILDNFSWTLGRAVLYSFQEAADGYAFTNNSRAAIGYYEPSSKVFVHGGEKLGIPSRAEYIAGLSDLRFNDDYTDDDDHDENDWDDVLVEHRWWGSLLILLILFIIAYLMMGRAKRQSALERTRRFFGGLFTRRGANTCYYSVQDSLDVEDLEMQTTRSPEDEGLEEFPGTNSGNKRADDDDFEIE